MIITCNNCLKKFNIDSSLIPKKGRLLQCNSCNHKWFFKKEIIKDPLVLTQTPKINEEINKSDEIELLDKKSEDDLPLEKAFIQKKETKVLNKDLQIIQSKNNNNYNILGIIIVFMISFVAIIIILDTFQSPISKIIPNIEVILYSLYETINDIRLFLKDLI